MTVHSEAPEVQRIIKKLVGRHHPHLHGIDVRAVFRDKATKSMGRVVLGTASIIKGVPAMLALGQPNSDGLFIGLVTIAYDEWEKLDKAGRDRLVDHELCHFGVEIAEGGSRKLVLVPHEIEEFGEIIGRYGISERDAEFLEKFDHEQLRLFVDAL